MTPSMVVTSFWPVFAAGVASGLLGWIWYHPKVFGNAWMRMINMTPEMAERGKKRMPLMGVIGVIAAMLVAWVMSYVGLLLGVYDWFGALELGFWCWLGFVAPIMLGTVLWEQRSFKLYLINAGYWLVALIVMALVLVFVSQAISPVQSGYVSDSNYITE